MGILGEVVSKAPFTPWGCLKSLYNRRARKDLRKGRKGKALTLSSLRSLRKASATSAVNGF
jgi:hypothetical protein